MGRNPSVLVRDEPPSIPPDANTLEGFRRWSSGESFPEKGRIDFLDGELDIDMSPEDRVLASGGMLNGASLTKTDGFLPIVRHLLAAIVSREERIGARHGSRRRARDLVVS